jgi:hypothetical protein
MFKKALSNLIVLISVPCLLVMIGVIMSVCYMDFQWLERVGVLVVCVGIIAIARPNIVGVELMPPVVTADTGEFYHSKKHWEKLGQQIRQNVIEDNRSRFAVGVLGPVLGIVGSVIDGYADLLNSFFGWTA